MPITLASNQITFDDNTVKTSANISNNQLLFDTRGLYYRNKIINGDMRINERYIGASAGQPKNTVTLNDNYLYVVDRFRIGGGSISTGSGSYTVQRLVDAPTNTGLTYSARVTTSAVANNPTQGKSFNTWIEACQMMDLRWGTSQGLACRVSFWVKGNIPGSYSLRILDYSSGTTYFAPYTINSANTWEFKEFTIPAPPVGTPVIDNSAGVNISWVLGSLPANVGGTANTWSSTNGGFLLLPGNVQLWSTLNAYIQVTGVQLEVGTKTTPFEHRPYPIELALCQRYFCRSTRWAWSQPIYNIVYRLIPPNPNVPMRTRPTVKIFHPGTGVANRSYEHSSGRTTTWTSITPDGPTGSDAMDFRNVSAFGETDNLNYSNYVSAFYEADF